MPPKIDDVTKVEEVTPEEEPKTPAASKKPAASDEMKPLTSEQQEYVNKLVGKGRLAGKAEESGVKLNALLDELGLDSAKDLKDAHAAQEAKRKEELTEVETANEARDTAQAALKVANDAAEQQAQAANTRLMRAEVIAEAAKPEHGINPEAIKDIWQLVSAHASDKVSIDDKGNVTGAADAIKEVLKERDHLKAKRKPGTTTPYQQKLKTRLRHA